MHSPEPNVLWHDPKTEKTVVGKAWFGQTVVPWWFALPPSSTLRLDWIGYEDLNRYVQSFVEGLPKGDIDEVQMKVRRFSAGIQAFVLDHGYVSPDGPRSFSSAPRAVRAALRRAFRKLGRTV